MRIERLREELQTVKQENEMLRRQVTEDSFLKDAVPPVVLEAHPPTPPKHPRKPAPPTDVLK